MELSKVVALAAVFCMIVLILTAGTGVAADDMRGAKKATPVAGKIAREPRCKIKPVMTDAEIKACRKGPKEKL